jgi:hypothetical protein
LGHGREHIGCAMAAGRGWTLSMRIDDFDYDLPGAPITPYPYQLADAARPLLIPASGGSKMGRSQISRHRRDEATFSFSPTSR